MLLSNRRDSFFLLAASANLKHSFNTTALGERLFGNAFFCAAFATAAKQKTSGSAGKPGRSDKKEEQICKRCAKKGGGEWLGGGS
jgi:hypothetical protein